MSLTAIDELNNKLNNVIDKLWLQITEHDRSLLDIRATLSQVLSRETKVSEINAIKGQVEALQKRFREHDQTIQQILGAEPRVELSVEAAERAESAPQAKTTTTEKVEAFQQVKAANLEKIEKISDSFSHVNTYDEEVERRSDPLRWDNMEANKEAKKIRPSDYNQLCKDLLDEIDQTLWDAGVWVGGRLDSIKALITAVKSIENTLVEKVASQAKTTAEKVDAFQQAKTANLEKVKALIDPFPEGAKICRVDAPIAADAGNWQPAERVFHQKVLDGLMRVIQEQCGQLVTERNAEKMLTELWSIKKNIEEKFGPYARAGEKLNDTIDRLLSVVKIEYSDEAKLVFDTVKKFEATIQQMFDRLSLWNIERVDTDLGKISETMQKFSAAIIDLRHTFGNIDVMAEKFDVLQTTIKSFSSKESKDGNG